MRSTTRAMSLVALLLAFSPAWGTTIYVDARPDTIGGVWEATVGDPLYAYVYINAESTQSILSHGAELDMQITGSGSLLPSISSITFIGDSYAYNSLGSGAQDALTVYSDQEAYRSIYSSSSTALIDDSRRILALVTIDTTGAAPGDYTLNPNGDAIGSDVLQGSPDVFTSGIIRLSAVPEPAVVMQLLGLLGTGGLGYWYCRRRARHAARRSRRDPFFEG